MKNLQLIRTLSRCQQSKYVPVNLVIMILVIACCFFSVTAQTLQAKIQTVVVKGETVKASELGAVLSNIANEYKIPISFETKAYPAEIIELELSSDKNNPYKVENKEIVPIDGSLSDVLDYLIQLETGYQWKIDNEIIRIYPIKTRSVELNAILNTEIKQIDFYLSSSPTSLSHTLVKTNEVKAEMNRYKLESYLIPHTNHKPTNSHIFVKNMTVREILDYGLINELYNFWIITLSVSNDPELKILYMGTN